MTFYFYPTRTSAYRHNWNRPAARNDEQAVESEVVIPINVKAGENDYVITAMLPGVKAEDLSIQIVNETVTIQGEIKKDTDENPNYLLHEQPTGRFYRVLRLPDPLNSSNTEAELVDGLLTLRVPKAEEARPRTIKVNTSNN